MATSITLPASASVSSAVDKPEAFDRTARDPTACHSTDWDDEIVEVTNYQPKFDFSDDDTNENSIASDALSNDLSDFEKATHENMSRAIPYCIERTYSSSDSERSIEDDGEVTVSEDDLSVLDYASVNENGLDELMRFGVYEPGGEPVRGVLIEPSQQQGGDNLSNINTINEVINTHVEKSSAALDTVGDGDASCSRFKHVKHIKHIKHVKHMMSLITWCNDDSYSDDEEESQMDDDHDDMLRSQLSSSHGSTVVMYEGPRVSFETPHGYDEGGVVETLPDDEGGDIETLPDDDADAADIETLDSDWDSEDGNSSERDFGEVETLDDSDDNLARMCDAHFIDGSAEAPAGTAVAELDEIGTISHNSNPVSDITPEQISDEDKADTARCEETVEPRNSTNFIAVSESKPSITKNSNNDTDNPSSCDKSSVCERKSREGTRYPRDARKKVSKFKKLTRLLKSCFSRLNE